MSDCRCQDSINNTYACLRHLSNSINKIYCEFNDDENFVEAYDLHEDIFEMTNMGYTWLPTVRALYSIMLRQLHECIGKECRNEKVI